MTRLNILTCTLLCSLIATSHAAANERILLLREHKQFSLLNDSFTLKLLKIHGYFVDVRVMGEKRRLKLGAVITPQDASCAVSFNEINAETKIARFSTTCP